MTRPEAAEFVFAVDWIHGGQHYEAGDRQMFPAATATMLERMHAGRIVQPRRRARWPFTEPDPDSSGDPQ